MKRLFLLCTIHHAHHLAILVTVLLLLILSHSFQEVNSWSSPPPRQQQQRLNKLTITTTTTTFPMRMIAKKGPDDKQHHKMTAISSLSRRSVLINSTRTIMAATTTILLGILFPITNNENNNNNNYVAWARTSSSSSCTDIDSCREIGDRKVEKDMTENPRIRLPSGVRYKVLKDGITTTTTNGRDDDRVVNASSTVDLIFSVSTLGGGYMFSKGFGYEKVEFADGRRVPDDQGLDSLLVQLGRRDVPLGIEQALVGMKQGERRRVEVPPSVGFETSNWKPEPTTRRGKAQIASYQQLLRGDGTSPPFPAPTFWDVEVLKIRNK